MRPFEYSENSEKGFDELVQAVEAKAAEKGFRVLHTHDVAATLAEKGFRREPLKIVEVCNAKYASQALDKDIRTALMLPCPISVYTSGGKSRVSAFLPTAMMDLLPDAGLDEVAREVEKVVREIVAEAAG